MPTYAEKPKQPCRKASPHSSKSTTDTVENAAPPVVQEVLRSPGQPLDVATRTFMEPRFGHSFANVRVHTDDLAAASAGAVDARAYTVGSHVAFGTGQFHPESPGGRKLIAHELAHVVQQADRLRPDTLRIEPARGTGERQAESMARAVAGLEIGARHAGSLPAGSIEVSLQRQTTSTADDWDFSVDDYQALRQGGGYLDFAPDGAWLPTPMKENILVTLMYLYETAGQRAMRMHAGASAVGSSSVGVVPFTGVNRRDLFHAHVVVRRAGMLDPSRAALQSRFVEARERSDEVIRGGEVTEANRPAYTTAVQAAEREATPLLESIARSDLNGDLVHSLPDAAMIYHTLEVIAGRMGVAAGDPRRNVLTRFDDLAPRQYQPPDPASASSFHQEFDEVMELSFLVDAAGMIHVHPGGLNSQSLTTGRNEAGVDRLLEDLDPGVPPARPSPTSTPEQPPPEFGIGRAAPGMTVFVNDSTHPTTWSYAMRSGLSVPLSSWHDRGRPNFVLIRNQRFFLHPDGRVAPY
jgi:hypothetical protein